MDITTENTRYFRHELKYLCSAAELEIIKHRLSPLLSLDSHTRSDGSYLIRSIYFDDYHNSAYFDNEAGTEPREKWRIRSYNCSKEKITLECKIKQHGMIHKELCDLSYRQYRDIMDSRIRMEICGSNPPLLNRFLIKTNTSLLHPVVLVQYTRVPFICREGNVRITFDCHIASSTDMNHFFERQCSSRLILPGGIHLLEVKYDEFLPDHIYHAVQLTNMTQTTFSKYYLCRKYNLKMGGTVK